MNAQQGGRGLMEAVLGLLGLRRTRAEEREAAQRRLERVAERALALRAQVNVEARRRDAAPDWP